MGVFDRSKLDLNKKKKELIDLLDVQLMNFQVTNAVSLSLQKTVYALYIVVRNQTPKTEILSDQLKILDLIKSKIDPFNPKEGKSILKLFFDFRILYDQEIGSSNFGMGRAA